MAARRIAWRDEATSIDPACFVFLDESGFDTRLTRTHARALHGQRAHGTAPGGHWRRLTLIGGLSLDGLCAAMTITGATNVEPKGSPDTAVFLAFVT